MRRAPGIAIVLALFLAAGLSATDLEVLSPPPQDQGLPYTRSARKVALEKIKNHIAVFAGSRYAYVKGYKVRLDNRAWLEEATLRDGAIFVPKSFARVLELKEFTFDRAAEGLADRWVYTLTGMNPNAEDAGACVAIADAARAKGLTIFQHSRGLLLIGETKIRFDASEATLLDSVITLFDTPEKFADPDIATRYIPALRRQGKWTDHVKATPWQLALLAGPETRWPTAPRSQYDFRGFDARLLGSKVPPPGVYPRVLFSPQDVPMLADRVKHSRLGQMALIEMEYLFQKSWWDASTSDGRIFQKLAQGDLDELKFEVPPGTSPTGYPQQFAGQKSGIFNSHIAYVPECLTAMAFYCLLTGDDAHGRQAAAAIANWYKLRETLLDEVNAISDSEFGSTYTRPDGTVVPMNGASGQTHWRTVLGLVAHMNLGLSLDFAGKWMTAPEKETMRRVIAKATYGRRPYGQDAPVRFRDVNWVTWDLPNFLAVTAIEGLAGFDHEVYESNCDTVRAFCDWGIDDHGVIYESNGKSPGGMQFQLLSMVALARRGENLFGHPHFRKLLEGQVQMTSPSGRVIVNSGTQYAPFSRQFFSPQSLVEIKAFFPADRKADYLLTQAMKWVGPKDEGMREYDLDGFTPAVFRSQVTKRSRLRLPSLTYPGLARGVLYDAEYQPATRAELRLPLDFDAPTHGVFSSYSDATPEAAWICMMVRPNHYLGAGHHHADAGMIHFSALGVDWFTESPFSQNYDGKYHNQVLVDGRSEPENMVGFANGYQAAAKYLGARVGDHGAVAAANLTDSYSYRWLTQPAQVWDESVKSMGWEMDPSDSIAKIFAGTARYKMRPWWANYTYCNYIPTCRALFNPMRYVFRTTGLVRGPHPYGFVLDDLKKDDQPHLYQWTAMLNGGVWRAEYPGLPANQMVLALREPDPKAKLLPAALKSAIVPEKGEPLLLVDALGTTGSGDPQRPLLEVQTLEGPSDRRGNRQFYDRLTINRRAADSRFRVLLIPFRMGEELPTIGNGSIAWKDQLDRIDFTLAPEARTRCVVTRGTNVILESEGTPVAPASAVSLKDLIPEGQLPESLVYKHAPDIDLKLHVFRPPKLNAGERRSAIVWIHGGG
jgi:hypothetical protein